MLLECATIELHPLTTLYLLSKYILKYQLGMYSEMQGLFQMRIRHDLVYPNIKSKVYEFAHQNLSQRQLSSTRHNYVLDFVNQIQ